MIKKYSFWLIIFLLGILQSCDYNVNTTYHKDAATSLQMDINFQNEMLGMMKSFANDSASKEKSKELDKFPKEWKNLYEFMKETGDKKMPKNQDSIKMMKKMFVKMNTKDNEMSGFSFKMDHVTKSELAYLMKNASSEKKAKLPLANDFSDWNWDGKTLTIDMEKINMEDVMKDDDKETKDAITKNPTKKDSIEQSAKQIAEQSMAMLKMFNMNISNTIHFENKIKSIVGKHDYVKQIDDKTIKVSLKTADLFDKEKKLKNQDKKIIITTE